MKETKKTFDKTEDDLKALQSMGQIIGEVLRQLDDEKCASLLRESFFPIVASVVPRTDLPRPVLSDADHRHTPTFLVR